MKTVVEHPNHGCSPPSTHLTNLNYTETSHPSASRSKGTFSLGNSKRQEQGGKIHKLEVL